MVSQHSISPLYKKVTYTSKTYDVPSGGALEFTTTLKTINGYSAVGVIETTTNHDWSFCLARATINSNNTMTITWMNLNQNMWKGAYGTAIVLYIKTLQHSISQYGTTSFSSQQLSVWKNMNMCTVDVPIGKTLPNNTYTVVPVIQRNGVPFTCSVASKTTTSFRLYVWTMGDFGAESFAVNWHISYQYSISPTTPTLITGDGYAVHKVGRIVLVTISMSTSIGDAWSQKSIVTLPSNYEPIKEYSCALAVQGGYDSSVIARITHSCNIVVQGKGTGWRSGWVFGSFAYISIAQYSISPKTFVDGQIKSGEAKTVRGISDWLMVGVYASAAAGDSDEKEMLIPCLVGDRFLLGSSGCAIDGDNPRYVSVRFTLNSESLRYVNVSMQDVSNGSISNGRNANGIIGLIRRQYSISQVTLKTVNGITCTYRVWSKKVVECCVSGTTTNTLRSGSVIDFGTIPSGLRPKTTSFIVCNVLWNGGKVYFRTYNDGSVSVLCADQEFSEGSSVRCSRTWIIQHSISQVEYFASESNTFNVTPKISGIVEVECVVHSTFGAWANKLSARIATPDGLTLIAGTASAVNGNDQVLRSFRARAVFSGVKSGSAYNFSVYRTDGSFGNSPSFSWFITVRQY